MRSLVAIPVFNEAEHIDDVLDRARRHAETVLVVDDGSTDGTRERLQMRRDVCVVTHARNVGYGAALRTAFRYASGHGFEGLVTLDGDGQHEPERIPQFIRTLEGCDVVSGSRYLNTFAGDTTPPPERYRINRIISAELKQQLHLSLSDSFCGFKAYRVSALQEIKTRVRGYAMPLEFWVEAVAANLRIRELPVPLLYLDENRSFGEELDQADVRLAHYRDTIQSSLARTERRRQDQTLHPERSRIA
ncbi:MAG: glycosyltransferase [Rubripirellula sp.]